MYSPIERLWRRHIDADDLCGYCEAMGRPEVARFVEHVLKQSLPGLLVSLDLCEMEQDFRENLDEYMDRGYESDAPHSIAWLRLEFGDEISVCSWW